MHYFLFSKLFLSTLNRVPGRKDSADYSTEHLPGRRYAVRATPLQTDAAILLHGSVRQHTALLRVVRPHTVCSRSS